MDFVFVFVCYLGNYKIVIELLKVGVDVNYYKKYVMFLKVVCLNGYMDIILELIEVGVDINLVDDIDILFIVVCDGGYNNVIFELFNRGVDVNLGIKYNIFLIIVCKWGNLIVVKKLLEFGVDFNIIIGLKEIFVCNLIKEKLMKKVGVCFKYSKLIIELLKFFYGIVYVNIVVVNIEVGIDVSF